MMLADRMRSITSVEAIGPVSVRLEWSDRTVVDLELRAALRDPSEFSKVAVGDWGHSLAWPSGAEMGADALWLETLSAMGQGDARAFLEWRLRNGLSLSKAADALGISRRMVAYYSNGEKAVPKAILLACRGWEVGDGLDVAA